MLRSHHPIVLQVNLSSGMSSGSMNGGVWICLIGYVLGGGGSLWGGRDIGVLSMVLTLIQSHAHADITELWRKKKPRREK